MIIQGDCLKELKKLKDNSIDSCVTDPPYGIGFMGKEWDTFKPESVKKRVKSSTRKGMEKDGMASTSGIRYDESRAGHIRFQEWCLQWLLECNRVLKPGGFLLVSCSTRMYHRMTCAIEDAGFEIRDMIAWVYGSGFPKSLNIGKAVDKLTMSSVCCNALVNKAARRIVTMEYMCSKCHKHCEIKKGIDREVLGKGKYFNRQPKGLQGATVTGFKDSIGKKYGSNGIETKGNSPYEGWGTALKPALEPITVARKPFKGTVAKNVLKWGTGGINIDGSRVESKPRLTGTRKDGEEIKAEPTSFKGSGTRNLQTSYDEKMIEQNLGRFPANFIHDGSDEVVELFPNTKVGARKKGQLRHTKEGDLNFTGNTYTTKDYPANEGSAARFFYCAKASKSERNKGLGGFEEKEATKMDGGKFESASTTATARKMQNNHPTVKPVKLMRYLVKLVTPPKGTVLDPFMGSGTTGIACKLEGFKFIGIELEEDYVKIAEARIKAWGNQQKLI